MNLIDSQIQAMMQTKYQLLATFLKAEQKEGQWGLVDGNTHAILVEPKKPEGGNADFG